MNTFANFKRYYNKYYQHYGRALSKKQDKNNFAYKKPSEDKQLIYNYAQKWLASHNSIDTRMTVLTNNDMYFTLGCVYIVTLDNYHTTARIFRVVTPSQVLEWYISGDYQAAVPLAPVPKHRIQFHNTESAYLTEMDIDLQTIYATPSHTMP